VPTPKKKSARYCQIREKAVKIRIRSMKRQSENSGKDSATELEQRQASLLDEIPVRTLKTA